MGFNCFNCTALVELFSDTGVLCSFRTNLIIEGIDFIKGEISLFEGCDILLYSDRTTRINEIVHVTYLISACYGIKKERQELKISLAQLGAPTWVGDRLLYVIYNQLIINNINGYGSH